MEENWTDPQYAHFLNRLASIARLIIFDKRGTGLSDRVGELPTLEQRMDDVRAVMDAAGSKQAVLMGVSEGGMMSSLFAATYPQRTKALIIFGTYAKRIWSPDYPWAPTPDERQQFFDWIIQDWGGVVDVDILAPSRAQDQNFRRWFAAFLRHSASPGAALALAQMNTYLDICPILPNIHVPTLVLQRVGDLDVKLDEGKYIAEHIPGAEFVALPGDDHLWWTGDSDRLLDEVEKFLVAHQHITEARQVLVSVLAVKVQHGDTQAIDEPIKQAIAHFRGQEIGLNEGVLLAAFDGPSRAIHCAITIREAMQAKRILVKIGIHTCECEIRGSSLSGQVLNETVHILNEAALDEIVVSSTVKDLVGGSDIKFGDRPSVKSPERWRLFKVVDEAETKLTKRELEILRFLTKGSTNQDIANHFTLSEHTVHRHIANIYSKLSVSSRTQAVAYALQHNLL